MAVLADPDSRHHDGGVLEQKHTFGRVQEIGGGIEVVEQYRNTHGRTIHVGYPVAGNLAWRRF